MSNHRPPFWAAYLALAVAAAPPSTFAQAMTVGELRKLASAGEHAKVIEAADASVAALPPGSRLSAWRIDFAGQFVSGIVAGERHAFVYTKEQRWGPGEGPRLEVPDLRPVLKHDADQYDETQLITCVDCTTGRKLWTRRFNGGFRFMAGPGDELLAHAAKLYRLDARTGEVTGERALPKEWRNADAFIAGGKYATRERNDVVQPLESHQALDLDSGEMKQLRYRPGQWSPNRLRVLRRGVSQSPGDVTATVSLAVPNANRAEWSYRMSSYSSNDPVWFENDALVLSGLKDTRGAVARVDGRTGEVEWTTVLPHGAYSLEHVYLGDNSHLSHQWDAVCPLAGHVAAIDGRAVVHFLDPRTGEIRATTHRAAAHFAMPWQVGENVVLAGTNALVAVPVDVLLGRAKDAEADVLVLKGRSLLSLGRAKEAAALAKSLTHQAPELADGWRLRADAARAAGDAADEVRSRGRFLELTGETSSPELLASHGLLARVPTGPVTAELAPVGPFVYAGSRDGTLLKLDVHSLAAVETSRFPADITHLWMKGDTLYRRGTDRHEVPVATFVRAPAAPAAHDPLYPPPTSPPGAPREWRTQRGNDGCVVRHEGRLYRPVHNGGLHVLDGQKLTTYESAVPGIDSWNLYLGPGGPLGYGTGGVYALDERLVPARKLINSGSDGLNKLPYPVPFVASDGRTIAAGVFRSEQSVIQVWTADGKAKLREEPVGMGPPDAWESPRMIPLGAGYFLSGDELAWVPTDPARPVWRFALQPLPRRPMRHQESRDYGFGTPRIVGDRLFVACHEGGVFVFSIDVVTRANAR